MKGFMQDLRYGLRVLRKSPIVTATAIIALALGIGANTAIFSVVNAIIIRPLPYPNAEELVMLGYSRAEASPANYLDWRNRSKSFQGMAALSFWNANLSGDGEPERLQSFLVSPDLFPLLGAKPVLGRTFTPQEQEPGNEKVVMLSHGLWQRRFGSDPGVIKRDVNINGQNYTVVGVMPPGFQFYRPSELWAPLAFTPQEAARRAPGNLIVVGRLKTDVPLQQAQAEMTTISRALAQEHPQTNTGITVNMITLHESVTGGARQALLVLLAAVAFVLLISCANVASLLLARASTRRKEMAIRVALGAGRYRIVRQLLTESVMLSVLGGALGLLLALWLIRILVATLPSTSANFVPRSSEIGIDGPVLLFTLLISVVTGLVFGLAPALQTSKPDVNDTLKQSGRSGGGAAMGRRLRGLLVVLEVAMSLVLLIGAGLMIKSFMRLLDVNPGFNPKNVLTMQTSLLESRYSADPQVSAFYKQALEKLKALPGVEAVGATSHLPLGGSNRMRVFEILGAPPPPPGQGGMGAGYRITTPDYYRALGIPLMKGRVFTEQDDERSPGVALVNDAMARRYFNGEDPVGKQIRRASPPGQPALPWLEVVGVVGDIRHSSVDAAPGPEVYVPLLQNPSRDMTLVMRTGADPNDLIASAREQILSIDKDQPVFNAKAMEQLVDESVSLSRFSMYLIGLFAALALILAAVGIYSVMSYTVSQRTHEIGIRMALGAQPSDVLKMVLKQGMVLTLVGVLGGLFLAFAVMRFISSQLYGVGANDLTIFGLTALLLAVVAVLSSFFPARKATKVDPLIALRYE
jgi:putative ABC transport system permease protein